MIPEINLVTAWLGEKFRFRLMAAAKLRLCVYVCPDRPRRIALVPDNDLADRLAAQGIAVTREWWSVGFDRDIEEPCVMVFPDFLVCRMAELSRMSGSIAGAEAPDIEVEVFPFYFVRLLGKTRMPESALQEAREIFALLEEKEPLREAWDVAAAVGKDAVFVPENGWIDRKSRPGFDWSSYAKVKAAVAEGLAPKHAALLEIMAREAAFADDECLSTKGTLFLRAMRELTDDPDRHQD